MNERQGYEEYFWIDMFMYIYTYLICSLYDPLFYMSSLNATVSQSELTVPSLSLRQKICLSYLIFVIITRPQVYHQWPFYSESSNRLKWCSCSVNISLNRAKGQ